MVPIPSWRVGRERLWFGPQDGRVQAHAEVSESVNNDSSSSAAWVTRNVRGRRCLDDHATTPRCC